MNPRVGCQRGHTEHKTYWKHIELGGPTGFGDYCAIPYTRSFDMLVYERDDTPGPLCPASDAVSEMIGIHGVWEPQGTALALHVLRPGDLCVDFGCHIGWYSLLALSCGARAVAIDGDPGALDVFQASALANGWWEWEATEQVIGPDIAMMPAAPMRFVKIDVEGAEADAIRTCWPSITAGLVDHILMEVSPILAPGYPELVERVIAQGYACYQLPPKQYPPVELDDPEAALTPYRLDLLPQRLRMAKIEGCGQMDVWFKRAGATW